MKHLSALIATIALALSVGPTSAQSPKPCSAPEYRQFDFWVGTWDVVSPDGKLAGRNRIERIEGGCGLQENWTGAGGGTGRSINTYLPADKQWHQFWLDSGGGVLNLSGTFDGHSLRLRGTSTGPAGAVVQNRITFTPNNDAGLRQLWEISRDEGKTWTVSFDGKYVRAQTK
jgi:hypothetical protein